MSAWEDLPWGSPIPVNSDKGDLETLLHDLHDELVDYADAVHADSGAPAEHLKVLAARVRFHIERLQFEHENPAPGADHRIPGPRGQRHLHAGSPVPSDDPLGQ